MSRSVDGQLWSGPGSEPGERYEAFCKAEDLKGLLQRLSDQIADADRRHSDSMREMQARLLRLGVQTGEVKAALPEHHAAAFARVEDGMAELAERFADAGRPRHAAEPEPSAPLPVPAPLAPTEPAHLAQWAPDGIVDGPATSAGATIAAARDAVDNAASASRPDAEARPQAPATPASEFRHYPDEPWDQQSAAALSRLYDSGEPGLPPRPTTDEIVIPALIRPAATVPPAEAAPAAAFAPAAPLATAAAALLATAETPRPAAPADIDREWLEQRLADVATRVEASLAELRPESSLLALGQRFDQFEERLAGVLQDVATRSDVEGLRLVEAHISELAGQLEQAQAQLARLDGIETQFAELRGKLTDEQIITLFGGLVPTEEDLSRFATDAANRAADRVVALLPPPAEPMMMAAQTEERDNRQIEALQSLLSSFIDERRRGETSTSDALETLQLAMQQLLDRVDSLETTSRAAIAAANRPAAPGLQLPPQPTLEMPPAAMAAASPAAAQRSAGKAALATEIRTFAEEAKAAAARATAGQASQPSRPAAQSRPVATDDIATRPVASPAPAGGAPTAGGRAAQGTPEAFDRARFVALARQAAEKAQGGDSARGAPAAPPAAPAETGDRAAQRQSVKDRLIGAAMGGDKGGKPAVRPGMLLVASVAFLVLAGSMFVLPKLRASGGARPAATIETPAQPRKAPPGQPSRSAPALEDDAGEAKPEPKRQGMDSSEPPSGERARTAEHRTEDTDSASDTFASFVRAESGFPAPVRIAATAPAAEKDPATRPATPSADRPSSLGIALQGGKRPPTMDEVMRARQRSHLASLSEQAGQSAAAWGAPESVATAALREDAAQASGTASAALPVPPSSERQVVEMPPAAIGPNSLRLAAQKGDASAQFEVAARFAEGKGVKQDFEQAAQWYHRSASQGLAQAQYRLATLHERGLGVKADLGRARIWYTRAAEQGNLKAMHNLAVISAGRDQGQPDYPTAAQWFIEAAERGLADSQFNLGILHESGLGVARDQVTALKWYSLAATAGDKEAARRRDLIKAKMDAIGVKEADDAIREWRAKPTDRMANDPRVAGQAWKQRTQAAR